MREKPLTNLQHTLPTHASMQRPLQITRTCYAHGCIHIYRQSWAHTYYTHMPVPMCPDPGVGPNAYAHTSMRAHTGLYVTTSTSTHAYAQRHLRSLCTCTVPCTYWAHGQTHRKGRRHVLVVRRVKECGGKRQRRNRGRGSAGVARFPIFPAPKGAE